MGKIGGAVVLVLGTLMLAYGASGIEYTQRQWEDCHDPVFLEDFSYQCRFLNLNVFVLGLLLSGGAVLMFLGGWFLIKPSKKRWEPPGELVT